MTDNEKLARWQGWKEYNGTWSAPETLLPRPVPNYLNDDAAAMRLLDTLVERGYKVQLVSSLLAEFVTWDCWITYAPKQTTQGSRDVQTRREAAVAAVLELIEKEDI